MEPGQRAAPGHGQARPGRARLHDGDVRRLGVPAAVPAGRHPRALRRARAAEPRQRVGLRPAHRRREERLRADGGDPARRPRPGRRRRSSTTTCRRRRPRRWTARASPRRAPVRAHRRPALLRAGVRGAGAGAGRPGRRRVRRRRSRTRSTTRTSSSTATRSPATTAAAGRVGQPPGVRHRPDRPARAARAAAADGDASRARTGVRAGVLRRPGSTPRSSGGPTSAPDDSIAGPAVIEEFGSTVPLHPGLHGAHRPVRQHPGDPGVQR